jgi:hypothetical protein
VDAGPRVLGRRSHTQGFGHRLEGRLEKTDAELIVDAEYTRPGVTRFLKKFKSTVKDMILILTMNPRSSSIF